MKPCKISAHSDKHSKAIFLRGIRVVRMNWNFVRVHKLKNQRDAKNSYFYLDKQKCFIPKKILSVPCTMDSSFFNRWRLDVLTFLIKGFDFHNFFLEVRNNPYEFLFINSWSAANRRNGQIFYVLLIVVLFSANGWRLDVLTFLIKGFQCLQYLLRSQRMSKAPKGHVY